jgi:hypothetical protein
MTEGVKDENAYAFLSDIRNRFINSYDNNKITRSRTQLTEFLPTLKQSMV